MKTILLSCFAITLLAVVIQAQVMNVCYNVPNGIFVADLTDCKKYFTCFNNMAYANDCPQGFEFDAANQMCDYAGGGKCLKCPPDNVGLTFLPIPDVCNKYIICAGDQSFYQACAGGLEFDATQLVCDFASKAKCSSKPAECPPPSDKLTFIPGGGECAKYTICYNGVGYSQTCAEGTVFNPDQEACVPSSQYTCPTSVGTSSRRIFPPLGPAKSARFELKERDDAGCPAIGTKAIPDPSRCSGYFFCVDGKSAKLSCAQGLHFDSKTLMCRAPRDATCAV